MNLARIECLLGAVAIALVACSSADDTTPPPTPKVQSVAVLVDANRDGYVNDLDAAVNRAVWDRAQGAAFLANLDDDDLDGTRDGEDEVVNGSDTDAYDLARIFLRAFPDAPAGASGALTIDAAAAPYVRVFRFDPAANTWTKALDATAMSLTLSEADVKAGVQLGIESKTLVGLTEAGSWNGFVEIGYTVSANGKPVSTETSPEGRDVARMRVAPWMMLGNSTPRFDTIFSAPTSKVFVQGVGKAIDEANANGDGPVNYWKITNWPGDQWTEDYFQTGVSFMPWGDGQVAGMRLSMPRPWGRSDTETSLPVNWLKKARTFQDAGYFVVYKKAFTGSTFDSHGNHDLIPPYKNGDASFPYGRIIFGEGALKETKTFYDAQEIQGPALVADTNWLLVGHIDEVFTYLPAATPRGWKLVIASPDLAVSLLKDWQSKGKGSEQMFVGKKWADNSSATTTIDQVLADPDLMSASQAAQAKIDAMVQQMKDEVGLTDDEIVELPVLFMTVSDGGDDYRVAYSPGVVNLRAFNGWTIVADPFGPKIDGVDGFKASVDEALGTDKYQMGSDGKGIPVRYADDWDLYHRLDGEVHCGTNFDGAPPASWQWWTEMDSTQGVQP